MAVKTYALLSELTGTLVLGVPQQFDDAALVGSKTDDLTGDVADERSAAGRLALGAADLVLGGVESSGFLYWNMLASSWVMYSRNAGVQDHLFRCTVFVLPVRSRSRGSSDHRMLCMVRQMSKLIHPTSSIVSNLSTSCQYSFKKPSHFHCLIRDPLTINPRLD